jgi:hypothetical protein
MLALPAAEGRQGVQNAFAKLEKTGICARR